MQPLLRSLLLVIALVAHCASALDDAASIGAFLAAGTASSTSAGRRRGAGAPARPPTDARRVRAKIDALKARGGYVTADVIDVTPETPSLEGMLAKFSREHWHDEDEVRFIIEGRGLFHIHPPVGPVFAIEVEAAI